MAFSLLQTNFDKKHGATGAVKQVFSDAGSATYNVAVAGAAVLLVLAGAAFAARKGWLPVSPGTRAAAALTDDLGTRLG